MIVKTFWRNYCFAAALCYLGTVTIVCGQFYVLGRCADGRDVFFLFLTAIFTLWTARLSDKESD